MKLDQQCVDSLVNILDLQLPCLKELDLSWNSLSAKQMD